VTTPHASDDPEPVQTAVPNLRLLRARDATEGFTLLGIAHVLERRSDRQLVLDRGYIAPQVRIDATGQLSTTASLLHGLVQQRARVLAARMGQLGHGVSELADFLMLQTLNRVEPVLHQYALWPHVHPHEFHFVCAQPAAEQAASAQ
jgi:type VI secretion system protein ImpJ